MGASAPPGRRKKFRRRPNLQENFVSTPPRQSKSKFLGQFSPAGGFEESEWPHILVCVISPNSVDLGREM